MAIALVTFGLLGLYDYYKTTQQPDPGISNDTVTHSTDTPDETPPKKACKSYKVPDDEPRKITIPSIDVSGCVQKVDVDQNNAIAVPTNIHLAGWFSGSELPGKIGASIIDGHVSGRYQKGIFENLKKLSKNDDITIERGDNSKLTFSVDSVASYPADKTMQNVYAHTDSNKSKLILITCGGKFNTKDKTYADRVVVVASLQQ